MAKGIGIVLVVYGHVIGKDSFVRDLIFSFHMPLFFFLSGLFFSCRQSFNEFVHKKAKALLLPFIAFFIVSELVRCYIEYDSLSTWIRSYKDFFYIVGPLWFLLALYEIFIITYIVLLLRNQYMRLGLAFSIVVLGYILAMLNIHLPLFMTNALLGWPFFALGLYSKYWNWFPSIKPYIIIAVGILSLALVYCIPIKTDIKYLQIHFSYVLFLIPAIGGTLVTMMVAKSLLLLPGVRSIFAYLGINSLNILCVHVILLRLYRSHRDFIGEILTDSYTPQIILTLMLIPVSITVGKWVQYMSRLVYSRLINAR